jgi:hypothetical protein
MAEADRISAGKYGAEQQTITMAKAVGIPPPVIVTVSLYLLKFQRELKPIMKGKFEFRVNRKGINLLKWIWPIIRH